MKFAKLFEVGDEQVLVVIEQDGDESSVTISSDYETARINEKRGFKQDDAEERAAIVFEAFGQEAAETFRDKYNELLK